MIIGSKDINTKKWHKVFILWPRRLLDGRWAFMQEVYCCSYMAHEIPVYARRSMWGWCYKEIED